MIKKIIFFIVLAAAATKAYKYLETKLLNDDIYLDETVKSRMSRQNNELVASALAAAQKHTQNGDYESALEHYRYAYRVLGVDYEYLVSQIEDENMRSIFVESKDSL